MVNVYECCEAMKEGVSRVCMVCEIGAPPPTPHLIAPLGQPLGKCINSYADHSNPRWPCPCGAISLSAC